MQVRAQGSPLHGVSVALSVGLPRAGTGIGCNCQERFDSGSCPGSAVKGSQERGERVRAASFGKCLITALACTEQEDDCSSKVLCS